MIKYCFYKNFKFLIVLLFICLFLFNCENNKQNVNNSIDIEAVQNSIYGSWKFNRELFQKEQNKIKENQFNLSDIDPNIKMIFYKNNQFKSYYDNQVTKGKWKIENDLLFMDTNEMGKWKSFKFTIRTNELVIFDRNYIIALTKLPS